MILPSVTFYLRDGHAAIIRSPKEAESQQILALQRIMATETEFYGRSAKECADLTDYWQLNYISKMNRDTHSVMLVCYVQDRPVALCKVWFETREREAHRATVSIAVAKSQWGRGIGTQLLKMAIEIAQHRTGITQLELQVVSSNRRAIRLYKKVGFHTVATLPNAVKLSDGKMHSRLFMVHKI